MEYLNLFFKKTLRFLLKPLSFAPALLVMYLIFQMSAQDGVTSSALSLTVSETVVDTASKLFGKELSAEQAARYTEKIHYYIRKLGHVTEYFILAVSVSFPLYVYRIRGLYLMLIAGVFCVAFAGLDEYHQSFVAGRGPSLRDVGIDSIGILAGIICVRVVCFIGRKTIFRRLSNDMNK